MSNIRFVDNDIVQSRRGIVVEAAHGAAAVSSVSFEDVRVEALIETREHYTGAKLKPRVPPKSRPGRVR